MSLLKRGKRELSRHLPNTAPLPDLQDASNPRHSENKVPRKGAGRYGFRQIMRMWQESTYFIEKNI